MNDIFEKGRKDVLLVDNSNSRTKFMFVNRCGQEGDIFIYPTAEVGPECLQRLTRGKMPQQVIVCSVVPRCREVLMNFFGNRAHCLSSTSPLNFDFDYPGVATLGADRIANVAGAVLRGRFPCVAVDFGTAVTYDVIVRREGRPEFIGGCIAPGLSVQYRALSRDTALLPSVQVVPRGCVVAGSTIEAIQAGCFRGFCGGVRELLRGIEAELGTKPYVIATGGDSALIANNCTLFDEVAPLLTFQGLATIAEMLP